MRGLKTWAWAVALAALTAAPALAQTTTGTTGTTRTATSGLTTGGTGGINGSSSTSTGLSGSSGSSGSNNISNTNQAAVADSLATIQQQNLSYTSIGTTASSSLQKSNLLSGFYANPTAMGMGATGAGAFGSPSFGTTTGTGSVTGGRGGATTGIGGRAGTTTASQQSGILIPLPAQIAYTAQMRFPTPPVATSQLTGELRSSIDNGGLANPKAVQVIVTGTNVVLRGSVKDYEEARLAEGLVRLTPGVGAITNELGYPPAP